MLPLSNQNSNILLTSKKCMDKVSSHISQVAKRVNKDGMVLKSIKETAKQINATIDQKIQENFIGMLNQHGKVELGNSDIMQTDDYVQKKQATKKLMEEYWIKKSMQRQSKMFVSSQKQNIFPPIKRVKTAEKTKKKIAIMSSLNVKLYEREKEIQNQIKPKNQNAIAYLFSYMINVIDYHIQKDRQEFLLFQKIHYAKWNEIQVFLKSVEEFCEHYQIDYCTLDLQKGLDLLEAYKKRLEDQRKKKKINEENLEVLYKAHDILDCIQNGEDISLQKCNKKGIRFYGNKGKLRAIIKVQAVWRGKLVYQKTKKIKDMIKKVIIIQKAYRIHQNFLQTKKKIVEKCTQRIKNFQKKQKQFQQSYRIKQLTKQVKYQIHINSYSVSDWQRFSTENMLQKQNEDISRIFRILNKKNTGIQTRIIYVSALPLSQQILNYYYKLLELGGARDYRSKIFFIPAEDCQKFIDKHSLGKSLYYSVKTLKKIKNIVQGQYCYIVPSHPSLQYIPICQYLNVPLYSGSPTLQKYLSTKSGTKQLASEMCSTIKIRQQHGEIIQRLEYLPHSATIYSLDQLAFQLSLLIMQNPDNKTWILKIDNQIDSRGLALFNCRRIIPSNVIKQLKNLTFNNQHNRTARNSYKNYENTRQQSAKMPQKKSTQQNNGIRTIKIDHHKHQNKQKQQQLRPQQHSLFQIVFNYIKNSFTTQQRLQIIDRTVYRDQHQYLSHFYTRGGIVQQYICSPLSQPTVMCYSVEIQPDKKWRCFCRFQKIVMKNKMTCCYYERVEGKGVAQQGQGYGELEINVPRQVNIIVEELIKRKCFGFFTIDFIKIQSSKNEVIKSKKSNSFQEKQQLIFNGINCYLDPQSSACFLRDFINKQGNMLYIPFLTHPNIKKITIPTFFHLCRLQNISFDIQKKIGNVFTFLDGLQSGCMGIMTFSKGQKIQAFIHAAEVLNFFSTKIPNALTSGDQKFLMIRNSINGYLNHLKKDKNKQRDHKLSMKSLSMLESL